MKKAPTSSPSTKKSDEKKDPPPKPKTKQEIEKILAPIGKVVITLDMDGTVYDPWACCGKRDLSWTGSKKCRHLRKEILEEVRALAKEKGASIVVLSWRGGGESSTRKWLKFIQLEVAAVFIPGVRTMFFRIPANTRTVTDRSGSSPTPCAS